MAKDNSKNASTNTETVELSEKEQKRIDLIAKIKSTLELNESKGDGPKVKVEGLGEVHVRSCGNCKWLTKKDERGINCTDLGVTKDLLPCSMKRVGNGFFEPVVLTAALTKAKAEIATLGKAELLFIAPMVDSRREDLLSEGITGFSIGMKVTFSHKETKMTGEVVGLTRTNVKVETEKGEKFTLLPGSLTKAA